MINNKYMLSTIAALLLGMGSANADPTLELHAAVQDAAPGDAVFVDLVASALPPDGIGGFDIYIAYDAGALSFVGYSLGTGLGAPSDSLDDSFGDLGGVVNLAEVSFLFDVASLQLPGPFILATLEFQVDVLAPGDSTFLDIFTFSIASGLGDDLTPGVIVAGAEIRNAPVAGPDSDGDGVTDDIDLCPGTSAGDPVDANGCSDDQLDIDNDGVLGADDNCANTIIPESVPTRSLGVNRFALVDGDGLFDTRAPKGKGPRRSYATADTAGCSCTQIIEAQGLGKGHTKFGCSISAMDDWLMLVN